MYTTPACSPPSRVESSLLKKPYSSKRKSAKARSIEARRWAYTRCVGVRHRVWVSFYTIGCRPRSQRRVPCRPARAPGGRVPGNRARGAARPDVPPPALRGRRRAPSPWISRGLRAQSRGIENQTDDPQRSKSQSETVRDKLAYRLHESRSSQGQQQARHT